MKWLGMVAIFAACVGQIEAATDESEPSQVDKRVMDEVYRRLFELPQDKEARTPSSSSTSFQKVLGQSLPSLSEPSQRSIFPPTPVVGRSAVSQDHGSSSLIREELAELTPPQEHLDQEEQAKGQKAFLGAIWDFVGGEEPCENGEEEVEVVCEEGKEPLLSHPLEENCVPEESAHLSVAEAALCCDEEPSCDRKQGARVLNVPSYRLKEVDDLYLQGYIQSLVDVQFYAHQVCVEVEGGEVTLHQLPADPLQAWAVEGAVLALPCVEKVTVGECASVREVDCFQEGVWLPHSPLFRPLLAHPREPVISCAPRWGDETFFHDTLAFSLGDTLPLLRLFGEGWRGGDVELGLTVGWFATYDREGDGKPLITEDLFFALPISWSWGAYSARVRYINQYSYMGREHSTLLPGVTPVDPHYHGCDWHLAWQPAPGLRYYVGGTYIYHPHPDFSLHPWVLEFGGDYHWWQCDALNCGLLGAPFFAFHVRCAEDTDWDMDGTFQLGWAVGSQRGLGRHLRLFVELRDGFSSEGQFSRSATDYVAIKGSYGF